ncbi:MAG TPA: hypothetical protein VK155_17155 [Bacteroidales bacterium]|nr:hypothetical protein [Bacteroidales bacterium]
MSVLLLLSGIHLLSVPVVSSLSKSLNGEWEMGYQRNYTQKVFVPGIHTEAFLMNPEKLWYRKEILLPPGSWKYATLELKGARFAPEVFVNGISVSKQNGGMAPTFHLLKNSAVRPGNKITLEIALTSLKDLPETDASYIPVADHWRSNISSCLWDDVILKLHGGLRIDRVIPFTNFEEGKTDFSFDVSNINKYNGTVKSVIEIISSDGKKLITAEGKAGQGKNTISISYGDKLKPWSPDEPNLYHARLSLVKGSDTLSRETIPFGVKDFRIKNKQFYLNNKLTHLYGGTVVWHRWVRDKDAREIAYDTQWFTKNIILRLKEHGANFLRYHLGVPPEKLLDLCDEYGLAVQYEWSFFHGMPASRESLLEQYPKWLDLAMRHPSVMLIHPYNETEGDQLKTVWSALDEIIKDYPPLVMEERDVIHIHKYWWSLFENLGLYYDSADQFPKTIMADEFGGNYLDGYGNMGGYKTSAETFLRFLGRDNTMEQRMKLHSISSARVAEYWRRIGAAGMSPFCIAGSQQDGSHWFLGELAEGKPKPVWNDLTAAWSPRSVSIELWDRNFLPGEKLSFPLYLFNDTEEKTAFRVMLSVRDLNDRILYESYTDYDNVLPFTSPVKNQELTLPAETGKYIISAELVNRPENVRYPLISKWEVNVFSPVVNKSLNTLFVGADEPELVKFLEDNNIKRVPLSDPSARIILMSGEGWKKLATADQPFMALLEKSVTSGKPLIILDAGDRYLGQGYPANKNDLGPLQAVASRSNTPVKTYELFGGIRLSFSEAAEPESHIHPDKNNSSLWSNIPLDHTWLWNGMRGGLIVPATNFSLAGLSPQSFLSQWLPRGADESKIKAGNYYAYSLEGFYDFSGSPDDKEAAAKLKNKLNFLIQDAPSLANSLNANASVQVTDLSKAFKESEGGTGEDLVPLVNAGKGLSRTPVIMIRSGKGKGNIIVSQLLTAGRLAKGFGEEGLYGIRYDPVAVQFVLNMMETVINKKN